MPDPAPRAALVELSTGHAEVLPFQVRALHRAGFAVEVHVNRRQREAAMACSPWAQVVALSARPALGMAQSALRLRRLRPHLIVANTAHGPHVRHLLWSTLGLGARRAGVVHLVGKLAGNASTRAIAACCDTRLVLSEHVADLARTSHPQGVAAVHFLPTVGAAAPAADGAIEVVVPGGVEPARRDYAALLAAARDPRLDPRLRLVALGRCDPRRPGLGEWLAAARATGRIDAFDHFVPAEAFAARLARAAGVLLLMHPGCADYGDFSRQQVSFALHQALAWRLPVLVERGLLPATRGMGPGIVPYDADRLVEALNAFAAADHGGLRRAIARDPAGSWAMQAARYLRALRQGRRP